LKRVRQDDRGTVVTGALTMHGVTKDVSGPVTVKGPVKDPWGNQRVGLQTKFTLDRREFGLTWNKALETGGVMVGDKVTIEISAEAVKQAPPPVK
jgi:polyisoprenoid-binding protein YceI